MKIFFLKSKINENENNIVPCYIVLYKKLFKFNFTLAIYITI